MTELKAQDSKVTEFRIKLWGAGMIMAALSALWVKVPWESFFLILCFGLAVIWGKRVHGLWVMVVWFSGFLFFGSFAMVFLSWIPDSNLFEFFYFLITGVFYGAFFFFFRGPNVKKAFGPSPLLKPLPVLNIEEEKRIRFWVKGVAVALVLEGVVGYTFSAWFRSHGLPPEGPLGTLIGLIAAFGLLFFRANIGRRFGIFVSLATWAGILMSHLGKTVFGFWGYLCTIFVIVIFFVSFLFLLHPKTKAVFR